MMIHAKAEKLICDTELHVGSMLVGVYAKCGSTLDSRRAFDRMIEHDVVSWTALVLGYAEGGEPELALEIFSRLRKKDAGCQANARTFLAAIKACACLADKEQSRGMAGKLVKLESLGKSLSIHSQALKSGCCESDGFFWSAVVDMYGKCGSLVDARMAFDRTPSFDVVSWNAMMLAYTDNREEYLALELLSVMMEGSGKVPVTDDQSLAIGLTACGNLAALETGKTIHSRVCRCGSELETVLANSLLDFYSKSACMIDARLVFDSSRDRSTATWTSFIAGYSRQGDFQQVFDLFHSMEDEGLQPDSVTFVSLLTACSHSGRVAEATRLFKRMSSPELGITPAIDHYICMADVLGRANRLDDAVALLKKMPHKPNLVAWRTVIASCNKWKNVCIGKQAFEALLELGERESAAYNLMTNIYKSSPEEIKRPKSKRSSKKERKEKA